MIEFKPYTNDKGEVYEALFIDGEKFNEGDYLHFFRFENGVQIVILEQATANKLASHHFSDFSHKINSVVLYARLGFIQEDGQISYAIAFNRDGAGRIDFTIGAIFSPEGWKKLWSIREYKKEFKSVFEQNHDSGMTWRSKGLPFIDALAAGDNIAFSVAVHDPNETLIGEARKHSDSLKRIHDLTEASLRSKLRQDSVVMHFDFPEEVKVPCEQYLLYFAQFLRDLGVQADTALTHEAGQVLFTVTPADKEQALDKIRAALNAYLHLPSNPISDAVNESIAVQRLESNILRLRSDLKLAAAELQAKNTTIEAQQLIIEVQKGLLSGEVIVNSMKDVTPKPKDKDKEELLGGTVSIIPLKGKGLEINLPELFRRLKRLFKEE